MYRALYDVYTNPNPQRRAAYGGLHTASWYIVASLFVHLPHTAGASGLDEEFLGGLGRIRETLQALPANAYVVRYGPPPRPFAA